MSAAHDHDSCTPNLARDLEVTGQGEILGDSAGAPPATAHLLSDAPKEKVAPVFAVTGRNLRTDVIERSHQIPVFVLIGSPLQVGMSSLRGTLGRLADSAAYRWVLGVLDPDQHADVVQEFRPQSLPAVYAVVGGTSVAVFDPTLPGQEVGEWVEDIVGRSAGKLRGLDLDDIPDGTNETPEHSTSTQPDSQPNEALLMRAAQLVNEGDFAGAVEIYDQLLSTSPTDPVLLRARAAVSVLVRAGSIDRGVDPVAIADEDPSDVDLAFDAADVLVLLDRPDEAVERITRLLDNPGIAPQARLEEIRTRLLDLVALLEPDHEVATLARQKLASALFKK